MFAVFICKWLTRWKVNRLFRFNPCTVCGWARPNTLFDFRDWTCHSVLRITYTLLPDFNISIYVYFWDYKTNSLGTSSPTHDMWIWPQRAVPIRHTTMKGMASPEQSFQVWVVKLNERIGRRLHNQSVYLRNVQWRPFQPWEQTQVPFLHCPCSAHRLSHGNWSHRLPVHPALQRHFPFSHTPFRPQSKLQTAAKIERDKQFRIGEISDSLSVLITRLVVVGRWFYCPLSFYY